MHMANIIFLSPYMIKWKYLILFNLVNVQPSTMQVNFPFSDKDLTGGPWPSGQYCFYQVDDSCPDGFEDGWILWQDERNQNRYIPIGL